MPRGNVREWYAEVDEEAAYEDEWDSIALDYMDEHGFFADNAYVVLKNDGTFVGCDNKEKAIKAMNDDLASL